MQHMGQQYVPSEGRKQEKNALQRVFRLKYVYQNFYQIK